jgi:hypothetical protein
MERRRDHRIGCRYELTLTDETSGQIWSDLVTSDVSATGLAFRSGAPHEMRKGERFQVRLLAVVDGHTEDHSMMLSTHATLVRANGCEGAVAFDRPLRY